MECWDATEEGAAMRQTTVRLVLTGLILGLVGSPRLSWAAEESRQTSPQQGVLESRDHREDLGDHHEDARDDLNQSVVPSAKVAEEIERLHRLQQEDPEAFRQAMQERKAQLEERLEHLKKTNPQAYQALTGRIREERKERLQELKERDPEKFQEVLAEHQAKVQERLQQLKAENPERYEQMMQKREDRRLDTLERMKQEHPEAARRFLEKHPEWAEQHHDRLQGVHDHREDLRERLDEHGTERPLGAPFNQGVRDHGAGKGRAGVGQGGERRQTGSVPQGRAPWGGPKPRPRDRSGRQ